MNTLNRIMALDVGKKRIGVAISDELQMFASPHSTITLSKDRHKAIKLIIDIAKKQYIGKIIIGYPLSLSGEKNSQVDYTEKFTEKLSELIREDGSFENSITIEFFDERLTSVQSERILAHSGKKNLERREIKDQISASIILESYLQGISKS